MAKLSQFISSHVPYLWQKYSAMEWKGVMPAVTTKFTETDTLDIDLFLRNINAQLEAGASGIILGGTLGEASTLTDLEKANLLRETVAFVNDKVPVIMNIAEQSTSSAINSAHVAAKEGAKGLMVLPPLRYKADERETLVYFKEIASATDLPIMIYNNPVDYGVEVSLEMFEELLKIPTIQAVKESTRDVSNVTRIKNRFGDRLKILCGVDTLAMESLLMGADGWVAGLVCAFPNETNLIYKLLVAGEIEKAREIYRWFLPLLELDINTKLVQNIKLAEKAVGLGSEMVRAPRLQLEGIERDEVLDIINQGIAQRPNLQDYQSFIQEL